MCKVIGIDWDNSDDVIIGENVDVHSAKFIADKYVLTTAEVRAASVVCMISGDILHQVTL